ncbi:MAG: methyltransferase domain-containing protein [Acidobacteriota bacterium]
MSEEESIKGSRRQPASTEIDQLYDQGYFFGETSGYAKRGYRACHPDWAPWLDLVARIKPSGVVADLGCAYGYLVSRARERGYGAFGLDISSFALAQEPSFRPWLIQARLEELPLASKSADIVALFDVLEHLRDPLHCLRESIRILKPDGLLIGATPDPLFFSRREPTHYFERPPSFWISALEDLNLRVQFRFSVEPFNFQFLAAFPETTTCERLQIFQHDYFEAAPDFVSSRDPVRAVPRSGWGTLSRSRRRMEGQKTSIYLLNPSPSPLRLEARFRLQHSSHFSTLRIRLNSLVLKEVLLTSEKTEHRVELPAILIPRGGHHLIFEVFPGGAEVFLSQLEIETAPASSRQLSLTLPFDLFQRYQLAREICRIVSPVEVLDVGGYLGDQDGHLATSADFLCAEAEFGSPMEVRTTDLRQGDFPDHHPAPAWQQPFPDQSFDLVLSLDVLEHLPEGRRELFFSELDRLSRNWILLGAPFSTPEVDEVEQQFSKTLMSTRPFLQQHLEFGLPRASQVDDFFRLQRGYHLYALPNGYLPRWILMQALTQLYFSLHDAPAFQQISRLYNQTFFAHDQCQPCYRTLFLIGKSSLTSEQESALKQLQSPGPDPGTRPLTAIREFLQANGRVLESLRLRQASLGDVQFLINERQKLIQLLEAERDWLRKELEETPLWRLARRRMKKRYGKNGT